MKKLNQKNLIVLTQHELLCISGGVDPAEVFLNLQVYLSGIIKFQVAASFETF